MAKVNIVELRAAAPESWTTFGTCSIVRKTVQLQGENPYRADTENRADVETALAALKKWMLPATDDVALVLLGELYFKTAHETSDSEDRKAMFRILVKELRPFPADIVCEVIKTYSGKFFPKANELKSACALDKRFRDMRLCIKALEDCLKEIDEPKPKFTRITPEQAAAIKSSFCRVAPVKTEPNDGTA